MTSHAEKANNVRDYFIKLREFINYYKSNFSNMIINNTLKYPEGSIYIILTNKKKNIFKLGHTKDIRKRLKKNATGKDVHPDIKFIMLVENRKEVENCVKKLSQKYQFKKNQEIYKINIDIMNDATPEDICYAFDRLNSGKPLTDSDRYYAMKDTSPLVKKAIELMKKPYWNSTIMKTKDFSTSKRKILPEVCSIVATIAFGNNYTSVSSKRLFDIFYKILPLDIDSKLENFFTLYNTIIIKTSTIPQTIKGNLDWHKTSKILGLILHDYLDTLYLPNYKEKMWIYIIKLSKTIPDFMFGCESVWNGFTKAQKRNCLACDYTTRLTRLREIYDTNTRNDIIKKYNISIKI